MRRGGFDLKGKFWWPSDEYSTPADNLCWDSPASPNADFFCIRSTGHPGKHEHHYSPLIRDYSHTSACTTLSHGGEK